MIDGADLFKRSLVFFVGTVVVLIVLMFMMVGLPIIIDIHSGINADTEARMIAWLESRGDRVLADGRCLQGDLCITGDLEAATGRDAAYVVAAYNAPQYIKDQAEYVCDYTDDDVQLQAAIDAADASGNGGAKVELTAGDFRGGDFTLKGGVTLEGCPNRTVYWPKAGLTANLITGPGADTYNATIRYIVFNGTNAGGNCTALDFTGLRGLTVEHCQFTKFPGYGIYCNGYVASSNGLKFNYNSVSECTKGNFYVVDLWAARITNNYFLKGSTASITWDAGGESIITGNFVDQAGGRAIYAYGAKSLEISDNPYVGASQWWGIDLGGTTRYCIVSGNNVVDNGKVGAGTHSGIRLSNTAHHNKIVDNTCWDDTAAQQDYGIDIEATCANNTIVGNSVYGNTIAGIRDQGTNNDVHDNPGHPTEAYLTGTISNGTQSVSIAHGLVTTPNRLSATGTSTDTASLYSSGNTTHVTVTAADGVVGGDRTVYCTALVR